MLKFLRKKPDPVPTPNPWGEENTQGSWKEVYSFPNSTRVAMQFIFAAINGKLPRRIQKHIRLDESKLFGDLQLYKIFSSPEGIQDHGTGRYRDRIIYFSFTELRPHSEGGEGNWGDCPCVYLRQYAGKKTWTVMSMTYSRTMKCFDDGAPRARSYGRYEVVVEPYLENEYSEHPHFVKSGFRESGWSD